MRPFLFLLFLASLSSIVFFALKTPEAYSVGSNEFVGSEACADCHGEQDLSTAGYNIWEEANKTSHPFAASGPRPAFPEGATTPQTVTPPPGTTWEDFSIVLGGYAWKTTFIRPNGQQYTESPEAQYNLESEEWVPYHPGEDLPFDSECARCHTTGTTPAGSWNGNPDDSLGTFTELGVQCEGCHGPSSLHADITKAFSTPEGEIRVLTERCGDCHNNGGKQAPIPADGGFLLNHTQYQEFQASRHGENNFITCSTCHEPHTALKNPDIVGSFFNGNELNAIRQPCENCHVRQTNHPSPITCNDCHMPKTGVSALGKTYANGGAAGDIASHIWRINQTAADRSAMFSAAGDQVVPDASGRPAITLDFACLGCHTEQEETLEWAASYATTMHSGGVDSERETPTIQNLALQNFPNPFTDRTIIQYQLVDRTDVSIAIYDVAGRVVSAHPQGVLSPGEQQFEWNPPGDLASGLYMVRLRAGSQVYTHMIIRG